jgi:hypothetical protein
MDKIALTIFLAGPFLYFVLVAVSFLLGGFIASRSFTVHASHRRVTFFWLSGTGFFAFTVLQLSSVFLSAVHAGVFDTLRF